jgi:hypothetical protein
LKVGGIGALILGVAALGFKNINFSGNYNYRSTGSTVNNNSNNDNSMHFSSQTMTYNEVISEISNNSVLNNMVKNIYQNAEEKEIL